MQNKLKISLLLIILSLFIFLFLADKLLVDREIYVNIAPKAEVSEYQTPPGYPKGAGGSIRNVIDLNTNSWWYGDVTEERPNWVELTWEEPKTIDKVIINFGGNRYAVDYKIQTWNGKSWDDRVIVTGNNSDPVTHYFNDKKGISTLKLRLYFTKTAIGDHIQRINEFYAYENRSLSISNILLVYLIYPMVSFMNYGLFLFFTLFIILIGIYWKYQCDFFKQFKNKLYNIPIIIILIGVLFAAFLMAFFKNVSYIRGIPGEWIWAYKPILDVTYRLWLPTIIFVCSILIITYSLTRKCKYNNITGESIIFLVFLAYFIQLGVFFLSPGGFAQLPAIINSGACFGYFGEAAKIQNIHLFLENYASSMLHLNFHVSTHPPGPVLLLWLINQFMKCFPIFANLIIKIAGIIGIHISILRNELLASNLVAGSVFSGFLLPLMGSFTIAPLYYLGKEIYNEEIGLYASILYMIIPGMILFIPLFDQMYPLLAITTVCLFYLGLKRKRSLYICLSAFVLSLSIFMSFGFLVMIPLLILLMLVFFIRKEEYRFKGFYFNSKAYKSMLKVSIIFLFTIGTFWGILYFLLHINMLQVYQVAMKMHEKITTENYRTYSKWTIVNLYDFFIFGGMPIFLLFIKKTISELREIKSAALNIDPLFIAFFLPFLLLDISGKVSGEVSRIWLFLMPLVVLLASSELGRIKFKNNRIVLLIFILILQFIQVVIFKRSFLFANVIDFPW